MAVTLPLVSCDPGRNAVGLALWAPLHGVASFALVRAELVEIDEPRAAAAAAIALVDGPFRVAVEVPQIYVAGRSKGSPKDLVDVAVVAGAVLGAGGPGSLYFPPATWKGQTPKEISTARTREALVRGELGNVVLPKARGLAHNVWDAVGIGLYVLRYEGRR